MKKLPGFVLKPLARWLADHPKTLFIAALIYIVSPIDVLPEALLGPLGFLDDLIMIAVPFLIREYGKKLNDKRRAPTPDVVETHLE